MSVTTADFFDLYFKFGRADWSGPSVWIVNPRVYKRHKSVFKKLIKSHRRRRLKRSVHRAWRKFQQQRQGDA